MPYDSEHILERRVGMLSEALTSRVNVLKNTLAPPGSRPLFTQQLTNAEALRFWRAHRYDDLGQRVLANMKPVDVMELDQALSQANESGRFPGGTDMTGGDTNAGY